VVCSNLHIFWCLFLALIFINLCNFNFSYFFFVFFWFLLSYWCLPSFEIFVCIFYSEDFAALLAGGELTSKSSVKVDTQGSPFSHILARISFFLHFKGETENTDYFEEIIC
jgi:hypothetical protein